MFDINRFRKTLDITQFKKNIVFKSHTKAQHSIINMHCALFAYNTFSNQFSIREPCISLQKEVKAKRNRNINANSAKQFFTQ